MNCHLRHGITLEYNIEGGDQIHYCKHAHTEILTPDVGFPILRDSYKREGNAHLDWNNRHTIEDFEEKEPLCNVRIVRSKRMVWSERTKRPSSVYFSLPGSLNL